MRGDRRVIAGHAHVPDRSGRRLDAHPDLWPEDRSAQPSPLTDRQCGLAVLSETLAQADRVSSRTPIDRTAVTGHRCGVGRNVSICPDMASVLLRRDCHPDHRPELGHGGGGLRPRLVEAADESSRDDADDQVGMVGLKVDAAAPAGSDERDEPSPRLRPLPAPCRVLGTPCDREKLRTCLTSGHVGPRRAAARGGLPHRLTCGAGLRSSVGASRLVEGAWCASVGSRIETARTRSTCSPRRDRGSRQRCSRGSEICASRADVKLSPRAARNVIGHRLSTPCSRRGFCPRGNSSGFRESIHPVCRQAVRS